VIPENIYGHARRLRWLAERLDRRVPAIELGCGTGAMITLPLLRAGFDIRGLDTDAASIAFGQDLLRRAGLDPARLVCADFASLEGPCGAVIASEVFEHLPDGPLHATLEAIGRRLPPGGTLLVTVPNGYGWFEAENFLWNRAKGGAIVARLRIDRLVWRLKERFLGDSFAAPHPPSTLSDSPHVQRFTRRRIRAVLEAHGFGITECTGTVLAAGQFSNLLFTGVGPVMRANAALGNAWPLLASGFLVACRSGGIGETQARRGDRRVDATDSRGAAPIVS
jgi:SAM-dependent methyltransferase